MKDLKLRIPMNLQFFAEGEGDVESSENVSEVADQTTGEGEESTETESAETTEEVTEPQFDTEKANAAFANMRREAEAAKKAQADLDRMFAEQFGQYKNPETGQPIKSAQDYLNAMAAQERAKAKEELRANNIDPNLIDNLIANSPIVKQAEAATAELNQFRVRQQMTEDLHKILAIDNSFSSVEELMQSPVMNDVVSFIESHPGIRADEAYKIVNFDRLSSSKGEAAKQAAINQVKGKNHLATGAAVNVDESAEDIPASQLEMYKEAFPGKTIKEIKALYNRALSARK
jgi:hypothetical protein